MNTNEKERQTTMCEIYDQIEGQGIQKGIEQERVHTEEQRRRADAEKARADAAEEENKKLRELLKKSGLSDKILM